MRRATTIEQSPSFQFYAGDWISDPNRMRLSLEEQGAYILLYCHCWKGFKIPHDYEVIARMCNCSLDKAKKLFPKIEHLFKMQQGNLICIQAEEERKEQAYNRQKRSMAGEKGAEKRWGEKI